MAIVLHDKFDSWQEFQDKLDAFCKETYQSFVKDDSKTVESVNKHRKEPFPPSCKFNKTECPKQSSVQNVRSVRIPVAFHG